MILLRHLTSAAERLIEQEYEAWTLCGMPLLERGMAGYSSLAWEGKAQERRYVRWLGGLAGYDEFSGRLGVVLRRRRLCGLTLCSWSHRNAWERHCVLGLRVRAVPDAFLRRFTAECAESLAAGHDHVYILTRHCGDAFQVLTLLRGIIRVRGSHRPLLLVFTASMHDLARMLCPELPCRLFCSDYPYLQELNARFTCESFAAGGQMFTILFTDWYCSTVLTQAHRRLGGGSRRLEALAASYGVSYDPRCDGRAAILEDAARSLQEKCDRAGFTAENFVLLAPESFTLRPLRRRFWAELARRFMEDGHGVFINMLAGRPESAGHAYLRPAMTDQDLHGSWPEGCHSFYLTFAEVYALAARAARIVTMRSGLAELLAQLPVPMEVLYTGADPGQVRRTMSLYAMEQYPGADMGRIREFSLQEVPERQCLDLICPPHAGGGRRIIRRSGPG